MELQETRAKARGLIAALQKPMIASTWINGCPADQVSSSDRGLQYGDGLFETITCLDGRPRWLPLHLQRLRRGCERLQLPFADFERLGGRDYRDGERPGRCIVKVILTRGPSAAAGLSSGRRRATDADPRSLRMAARGCVGSRSAFASVSRASDWAATRCWRV